jgi:hypothetical protein
MSARPAQPHTWARSRRDVNGVDTVRAAKWIALSASCVNRSWGNGLASCSTLVWTPHLSKNIDRFGTGLLVRCSRTCADRWRLKLLLLTFDHSRVTPPCFRLPTMPTQGYANHPRPRLADPPSLQTLSGRCMGSPWILRFDNPSMLEAEGVRATVETALSRTFAQLSPMDSASGVSHFNRAAPSSRTVLTPQLAQALACALRWAALSDGIFDPTVGPLVKLWAQCARVEGLAPARPLAHEVTAAQARVGWRHLRLDGATRTIVQPGGMWLDLAAIINGVAIDHAATMLRARQVRAGHPGMRPWTTTHPLGWA